MPTNVTWNKSRPGVYRKVSTMEKLADDPSWTCVQLVVTFPPNSSSPPHRHGGANVFALVAEGEITSAMNEGDAKVYKRDESWYEAPGCLHRISDNDSQTETARLIATFLIKTEVLEKEGPGILVQVEPEYLDQVDMAEAFKEG